MGVQGSEVCA